MWQARSLLLWMQPDSMPRHISAGCTHRFVGYRSSVSYLLKSVQAAGWAYTSTEHLNACHQFGAALYNSDNE